MSNLTKASKGCSNLETSKIKVEKSFDFPKIYSLEDDEIIKGVLKYIFAMVGLHNIPSKEEFFVLTNYVKNNYSSYSTEEIVIAFELALSKQIVVETNHFGLFSCSYFSNIMGSYSEYRERIAKEYMAKQQREKDLENQNREVSQEEIDKLKKDFYKEVLKPLFDEYKKAGKLVFGYVPTRVVYESLKNDYGIINIEDKQKDEIKKESWDQIQTKHKYCKLTGEKKTKKEMWKELCQVKAIEISFNKIDKL